MRTIQKGPHLILLDDEDFDLLGSLSWNVRDSYSNKTFYAQRYGGGGRRNQRNILLHREIMGFPKNKVVDHINSNGLDCQRSNLRIVTQGQNLSNRGANKGRQYKGVYEKVGKKASTFMVYAFGSYLGTFKTIEEAVSTYNKEAVRCYGAIARLNVL